MNNNDLIIIQNKVRKYYSSKLSQFGPGYLGVDWNSSTSQELRFQQLIKILPDNNKFVRINDVGCGYGALFQFLTCQNYNFSYCGFDISQKMITSAKKLYGNNHNCSFRLGNRIYPADYTLASGLFNVKLDISLLKWKKYILDLLNKINQSSSRGMAFNLLTSYSDKDMMRPDLYYGDPLFYFDYCKRNFSQNVALLHDYGLFEFTILVKKNKYV